MSELRTDADTMLRMMLKEISAPGERFTRSLTFICTLLTPERGILVPSTSLYPDLPPVSYGFSLDEWETPRFAFPRSVVVATFHHAVPLLTSDAQPDHHHDIARSIGLHSIVCAPIQRHSQTHAVICLQRRLTNAPFTPDDLDLLERMARFVA